MGQKIEKDVWGRYDERDSGVGYGSARDMEDEWKIITESEE